MIRITHLVSAPEVSPIDHRFFTKHQLVSSNTTQRKADAIVLARGDGYLVRVNRRTN